MTNPLQLHRSETDAPQMTASMVKTLVREEVKEAVRQEIILMEQRMEKRLAESGKATSKEEIAKLTEDIQVKIAGIKLKVLCAAWGRFEDERNNPKEALRRAPHVEDDENDLSDLFGE
jgi:hypothetical protein